MNTFFRSLTLATLAMSGISVQAADETFKPFVLAATSDQDLETVTTEVIDKLGAAGFTLAGQYAPMNDTKSDSSTPSTSSMPIAWMWT